MKGFTQRAIAAKLVKISQRVCSLILSNSLQLPFLFNIYEFIFSRRSKNSTNSALHNTQSKLVTDCSWWYPARKLPDPRNYNHSYFDHNGTLLADSLRLSHGREAQLTATKFQFAIIKHSWTGVQIKSHMSDADRELSSGTEGVPRRIARIHDAVLALQRNDQNYGHFLTEVLPSIIAWESPLLLQSHLVVAKTSFGEPLLRLMGFTGKITQIPPSFIAIATNSTILRLLPAGQYNVTLLREMAHRALRATNALNRNETEVVFLSRTAKDRRQLINESQTIATIQEVYPDVKVLYPSEMPMEEQIRQMANAKIVIAPHSSGAVNIIWALPLEHYVEISYFKPEKECFYSLANALGAKTHRVASHAIDKNDHFSNHECDLRSLRSTLKSLKPLKL